MSETLDLSLYEHLRVVPDLEAPGPTVLIYCTLCHRAISVETVVGLSTLLTTGHSHMLEVHSEEL